MGYRFDKDVSDYNDKEVLNKFTSVIEDEQVWVGENEINSFLVKHPRP
ncbi:MAG: hypothetical protein ACKVJP_14135 [Flavobacteriales bacterium]